MLDVITKIKLHSRCTVTLIFEDKKKSNTRDKAFMKLIFKKENSLIPILVSKI